MALVQVPPNTLACHMRPYVRVRTGAPGGEHIVDLDVSRGVAYGAWCGGGDRHRGSLAVAVSAFVFTLAPWVDVVGVQLCVDIAVRGAVIGLLVRNLDVPVLGGAPAGDAHCTLRRSTVGLHVCAVRLDFWFLYDERRSVPLRCMGTDSDDDDARWIVCSDERVAPSQWYDVAWRGAQ